MSKAPAFQFYPADYRKDPALRMASWATRGIWMEVLCCMWEATDRGELQGSVSHFCRLIGCSEDEFGSFLAEAESLRFADVSWDCHGNVTLRNRRMIRDEKRRKDWGKWQANHRSRSKGESLSGRCQADVNPMSGECQDVENPVTRMSGRCQGLSSSSDQEPTPTSASVVCDLVSQDPNEVGVAPLGLAAQVVGEAPPPPAPDQKISAKAQKPKPERKATAPPSGTWGSADEPFVAVLREQGAFRFELLDFPDWWGATSKTVGQISPPWLAAQFAAMQAKFLANPAKKPVATRRATLGFVGAWLKRERESERRRTPWQTSLQTALR